MVASAHAWNYKPATANVMLRRILADAQQNGASDNHISSRKDTEGFPLNEATGGGFRAQSSKVGSSSS